jgi:hypothetical protein
MSGAKRKHADEKPPYEKSHLVDIVDGRGLFHEDGFLVLEDYRFRQSPLWTRLQIIVAVAQMASLIPWLLEVFHHPIVRGASGWFITLFYLGVLTRSPGDTVLLETKGLDIYFGGVRVGRPKYVRYDFGWSLWGYTMFIYDDDAAARPRRVFFASVKRDSVQRVAAAVDGYLARGIAPDAGGRLGRGVAPDADPTVWPPPPADPAMGKR